MSFLYFQVLMKWCRKQPNLELAKIDAWNEISNDVQQTLQFLIFNDICRTVIQDMSSNSKNSSASNTGEEMIISSKENKQSSDMGLKAINSTSNSTMFSSNLEPKIDTKLIHSYEPTKLGLAILKAGMLPEEGLIVYQDILQAQQCLVIENDLHMLYLLSPVCMPELKIQTDIFIK